MHQNQHPPLRMVCWGETACAAVIRDGRTVGCVSLTSARRSFDAKPSLMPATDAREAAARATQWVQCNDYAECFC